MKRDRHTAARHAALVDGVWPRGRRREALLLGEWVKDLAPSSSLRRWFGHDPARWKGFQQRYREELSSPEHRARMQELLGAAGKAPLTLVYGAPRTRSTTRRSCCATSCCG
ncbi:MAG TPA: DUF488 family protein [Casimicrobiaceae bacterium]|nr:DUF488 family protein [Casimicrobiaceae bacterium]